MGIGAPVIYNIVYYAWLAARLKFASARTTARRR